MVEYTAAQGIGPVIARLRAEAGVTQAALAEQSCLDQSRVSRIEKGEVFASADVDSVLEVLDALGTAKASEFKEYIGRDWLQIEPPSFWNPERACLEITEETLNGIATFLANDAHPWPLRRQIERQRDLLLRATSFLGRLNHNIAFMGDMGVGKSTAISFIFDLLAAPLPRRKDDQPTRARNRRRRHYDLRGAHQGRPRVWHFPAAHELTPRCGSSCRTFAPRSGPFSTSEQRETGESIGISREAERAIRNMSGLGRRRQTVDGKTVYHDPVAGLVKSSSSEDEFRTRVLALMNLDDRTLRKLWYGSSTRKHPMEWVTETFKGVNNGRLKDVPLPKSIDLLIPNFGRTFGELDITVIDTKGVDDVAVREDLDHRLKDPRTAIVFCSRFNDAPGTSTRVLLQAHAPDLLGTLRHRKGGGPSAASVRGSTRDERRRGRAGANGHGRLRVQANARVVRTLCRGPRQRPDAFLQRRGGRGRLDPRRLVRAVEPDEEGC